MKRMIFCLLTSLALLSCNNSAKQAADQQAREKFIADSVAQSIQAAIMAKQNYEDQKNGIKKAIDSLQQEEYQLEQSNARAKADLTAAEDNLNSVSEFHLLRSSDERQAQIRSASLKVNELKQLIANIRDKHLEVQSSLQEAKQKFASMQ